MPFNQQVSLNIPTPPVTVGTVAPPVSVTAPPVGASLLNSTLLSAVLLTFGGERYSPMTATNFGDEYDFIVVGAGSAGSVVASRLSELPCVSVLLLEAGKTPPPITEIPALARAIEGTDYDWAYKTTPQKYSARGIINQQILWPSGKTVGGSSIVNAMFYVRGNHQNYDNWAAAGAQGWSYKDVLPYFIKAEDNQRASYIASGYHGKGGPVTVHRPRYRTELKDPIMRAAKYLGYDFVDSNGARQTGFFDFQSTMRGGKRCSASKAYLVPAENRTNLDIVQTARVLKVIIKNKRAIGVLVDYMGQTRTVRARKEVILSAGTVNTAQLLMLSGIGPKEHLKKMKIPVVADLPVGENFHDHAATLVFYEITNKTVQPVGVKIATGASQYVAKRSGPLASAQFMFMSAFLKNNQTHPAVDFPNQEIYQGEGTVDFLVDMGMKPDVYAKTFAPYSGKPMLVCVSQMVQPKSRGTVRLKSSDPYTPPIINPNYFEDPQDAKDVVEGLKNCDRLCTSPPVKTFGVQPLKTLLSGCEAYGKDKDKDKYLDCYVRSVTLTANHQVGTAKMGDPNDPTTVVDPLLRVKNIDGLRIVDCSVMPIVPSGNTNAPAYMVGEKGSDIIKSTVDCGHQKKVE